MDVSTPNGEVTFPRGAPARAYLRGLGIGPTEVSFAKADGKFGKWQDAEPQAQEERDPRRFASGWMPVPAGTVRVRLRPDKKPHHALLGPGGPWMVRDLSIWSLNP